MTGSRNDERGYPMQFILAPIGTGWAVACSRGIIPGAILRTKEAALRYVTALAVAGGFNDVRIVVATDSKARPTRRALA